MLANALDHRGKDFEDANNKRNKRDNVKEICISSGIGDIGQLGAYSGMKRKKRAAQWTFVLGDAAVFLFEDVNSISGTLCLAGATLNRSCFTILPAFSSVPPTWN